MNFSDDDRGLAVGYILFFAALVIVGLLVTMFSPMIDGVNEQVSDQTSDQDAQDTIDQRQKIWDRLPFYGVFIAGIFLIARAVFESRGR